MVTTRRTPDDGRNTRALGRTDLHRRPILRRNNRILGDQGRNGWPGLRSLGRKNAHTLVTAFDRGHSGQPGHAQERGRGQGDPERWLLVPISSALKPRPMRR